jgi:hypothetical protein
MKRALLVFVIYTSTAFAQTNSRISLECGTVTIWLGMAQSQVEKEFHNAGYYVPDLNAQKLSLVTDLQRKHVYSVGFESEKLVYASRDWPVTGTNQLSAVIGSLSAFAANGKMSCSIQSSPLKSPDISAERVIVNCGERSLVIAKGKSAVAPDFAAVTEWIGTAP